MEADRQPTIDDVVRLAGVGKGTVSRVLNGSASVSEITRAKVQRAIAELRFRPNVTARRLSRGKAPRQIGVLESFITSPSFTDRLRGIQAEIESTADFELLMFSCGSPDRYARRLESIVEQRSVEGLLIVDLLLSDAQAESLSAANIEVVQISSAPHDLLPSVAADDFHGGWLATRHLIDLGHRRIGYVGDAFPDPFGFNTSRNRYGGYVAALEEAGLPLNREWVGLGRHGQAEANQLTVKILSKSKAPTAIFAMSDTQALGCMAGAQSLHRSVPRDVSIIGFDDIEISDVIGLTTVRQHLAETGRIGARYLLARLSGNPHARMGRIPRVQVIERRTTAAAKRSR